MTICTIRKATARRKWSALAWAPLSPLRCRAVGGLLRRKHWTTCNCLQKQSKVLDLKVMLDLNVFSRDRVMSVIVFRRSSVPRFHPFERIPKFELDIERSARVLPQKLSLRTMNNELELLNTQKVTLFHCLVSLQNAQRIMSK